MTPPQNDDDEKGRNGLSVSRSETIAKSETDADGGSFQEDEHGLRRDLTARQISMIAVSG